MYEQDFLNILTFYCDYKVKFLDFEPKNMGQYVLQVVPNEDKDKFWNLASKGYWSEVILKDKKLVLPKNSGSEIDAWPDDDKTLVGIHFAGGNLVGKFDQLDTQFEKDVAHYLKYLISNGQKT